MSQWWSWVLAAIGVAGMYLVGRRKTYGWAVGLLAQTLWITYAVATRQWGFVASAFAYGLVNAQALARWRGADRRRDEAGAMAARLANGEVATSPRGRREWVDRWRT